jgi:imidazole glycerol-phosphate synthase subunit HisF
VTNLRPRVIPCLQLQGRSLVKTRAFRDPVYLGDPVNAARIFNDREADELIVVDIAATREGRSPAFDFIADFAGECFMPLAYGGGITRPEHVGRLFALGVEKAVLNTAAVETDIVQHAAREHGSQSIVVAIDAKRGLLGRYEAYTCSGTRRTRMTPVELARRMEQAGAGEIFLQSIDYEGAQSGFDEPLLAEVAAAVQIPVIGCGGAGSLDHFRSAFRHTGVAALAAGTMFCLHGRLRAPLISFPDPHDVATLRDADTVPS